MRRWSASNPGIRNASLDSTALRCGAIREHVVTELLLVDERVELRVPGAATRQNEGRLAVLLMILGRLFGSTKSTMAITPLISQTSRISRKLTPSPYLTTPRRSIIPNLDDEYAVRGTLVKHH